METVGILNNIISNIVP